MGGEPGAPMVIRGPGKRPHGWGPHLGPGAERENIRDGAGGVGGAAPNRRAQAVFAGRLPPQVGGNA